MGSGVSSANCSEEDFSNLRGEYVSWIAKVAEKDKVFRETLKTAIHEINAQNKVLDEKVISHETVGEPQTLGFRLQPMKDGRPVSLWHDIPLFQEDENGERTGSLHFVCEIPKFTKKKFEIATTEFGTPIKQDEKKGVLREFQTGAAGLFFNYGCFPQTWENPSFIHPDAHAAGDNDPLDVCEIGSRQIPSGQIRAVKVLGVLCMIDEGEADWKVIVIDSTDPWATALQDTEDVERLLPGTISAIREWFRNYKLADGKPENVFGLNERCMNKEYAMSVINECNHAWLDLLAGKAERHDKADKLNKNHRPSMASLSPEQLKTLASRAQQVSGEHSAE